MTSLTPHAKKILDGYGPYRRIALAYTLKVRPVGSSLSFSGIVGGAHKVAVMSQQRTKWSVGQAGQRLVSGKVPYELGGMP